MAYLVDTNVLVRLANTDDALFGVAELAVQKLHRSGETLLITAQAMIEFRNVATRSKSLNGLGLSVVDAETKAAAFELTFPLVEEIPAIYPAWQAIVQAAGVIGKQVHDARLVAVCHAHGVTHLLTFNEVHFARLASLPPGLIVVSPMTIGASA